MTTRAVCVSVLALALPLAPATAQTGDDEAAIRAVIERAYVQGLHVDRDEAAVRAGFHPDFVMTVHEDGGVLLVPLDMWLEHLGLDGVANDLPVEGRFTLIDITGGTAVAKLEVHEGGEHVYTDYFGLYKLPSGWTIVNKLFESGPGGG